MPFNSGPHSVSPCPLGSEGPSVLLRNEKGLVSALEALVGPPPPVGTPASLNAIDYVMQAKAKFASLIINPAAASLLNETTTTSFHPSPPYLAFIEGARTKRGMSEAGA